MINNMVVYAFEATETPWDAAANLAKKILETGLCEQHAMFAWQRYCDEVFGLIDELKQ